MYREDMVAPIVYRIIALSGLLLTARTEDGDKRYLVFPPPGTFVPTKVQLILGLGLPMETVTSTIIGYVVKFNYNLPYNASYLTQPYVRHQRATDREANNSKHSTESIRRKEGVSRWEIYRTIESALEVFQSGRVCLLRAICEMAETPLNGGHGLFAELLRLLLTPSTTRESFRSSGDREYLAAEAAGRDASGRCVELFAECECNPLEYFTEADEWPFPREGTI